jgi:phage terminase small subunit
MAKRIKPSKSAKARKAGRPSKFTADSPQQPRRKAHEQDFKAMTNPSQPLENPRHEAFVRAIVIGKSEVDAYVAAGYIRASARHNAARMRENEGISARIDELMAEAAQGAVMAAPSKLFRANAAAAICLPAANERRLTQKQLAQAVGVHERVARYWELKHDKAPTSTPSSLEKIEAVVRDHGVIVCSTIRWCTA